MKTIRMARTIRRELPNGWLAWIGPDGIYFRPKRQALAFSLSWREIVEHGQFVSIKRKPPVAAAAQGCGIWRQAGLFEKDAAWAEVPQEPGGDGRLAELEGLHVSSQEILDGQRDEICGLAGMPTGYTKK